MSNQSISHLPKIAIIGAGKVGVTVGTLLQRAGYTITAVAGRDLEKTASAARSLESSIVCTPEEAAKSADIVLLSVSDDAIEAVCKQLVSAGSIKKDQLIVHFSGALSSIVLAGAKDQCGALVASIHPLQTFSSIQSAIASLPGAFWFCEGDEKALESVTPLIGSIGGKVNLIPTEKKALYHASSVIACNYLVALMDIALSTAESASLERELAWRALEPLVQATLQNVAATGTTEALTGPIARGDIQTVKRHLQAIEKSLPEFLDIYKAMGRWTAKIAERKGLKSELAHDISSMLEESP